MTKGIENIMEASFRVVTPMFLGGATHEAERIRGTAVKGALAFWWRTFHFARFVKCANGSVQCALDKMRERETALFGSSDGGQGRFLIRVRHGDLARLNAGNVLMDAGGGRNGQTVGVGARYLGYGVINAFRIRPRDGNPGKERGELVRECIAAGQSFQIDILFRPGADCVDKQEIATALKLLGLLGGLGARVRRGWGSLALEGLSGCGRDWQGPQDREGYRTTLNELFRDHPGMEQSGTDWPLTAFAEESGIWVAGDPLLKALSGNGGAPPHVSSLPNRFKAEVGKIQGNPGGICADAARAAWRKLADAVWQQFVEPHAGLGNGTMARARPCWMRWQPCAKPRKPLLPANSTPFS